jgi:hypothetical protein
MAAATPIKKGSTLTYEGRKWTVKGVYELHSIIETGSVEEGTYAYKCPKHERLSEMTGRAIQVTEPVAEVEPDVAEPTAEAEVKAEVEVGTTETESEKIPAGVA